MNEENTSLEELIRNIDKAELHVHLEGTLEPELMFELAGRNRLILPYESISELRAAYQFSNLQDFLDIYYRGLGVLRSEDDFYQLTTQYLQRVKAENVSRVEMFFDPQAHVGRGIDLEVVMKGVHRAIEENSDPNFSAELILCFLRHLSESEAFDTLELAEPFRQFILGVGLDSSEIGHPPSKFKRVFSAARDQGYRLVAHAGEEGPPEYVWEALDVLGVERLDHGNRALEDRTLVNRLERDRIPLTVCPLSNLKLCLVDDLRKHPLAMMLDSGLVATVNSDDPAYFGGYVNENYVSVARALNLSNAEVELLAHNSKVASFQ